jgi:hypothetical protein
MIYDVQLASFNLNVSRMDFLKTMLRSSSEWIFKRSSSWPRDKSLKLKALSVLVLIKMGPCGQKVRLLVVNQGKNKTSL